MGSRADKAVNLFNEGYNCSQAVFCAFSDLYGIDDETAKKLSIGFGGGFGRMREVCGAFSGCTMILGLSNDSDLSDTQNSKKEVYAELRDLSEKFKEKNGSIICRELLGLDGASESTVPEKRTEQYKKTRPCEKIVRQAAQIMEEYIKIEK